MTIIPCKLDTQTMMSDIWRSVGDKLANIQNTPALHQDHDIQNSTNHGHHLPAVAAAQRHTGVHFMHQAHGAQRLDIYFSLVNWERDRI